MLNLLLEVPKSHYHFEDSWLSRKTVLAGHGHSQFSLIKAGINFASEQMTITVRYTSVTRGVNDIDEVISDYYYYSKSFVFWWSWFSLTMNSLGFAKCCIVIQSSYAYPLILWKKCLCLFIRCQFWLSVKSRHLFWLFWVKSL